MIFVCFWKPFLLQTFIQETCSVRCDLSDMNQKELTLACTNYSPLSFLLLCSQLGMVEFAFCLKRIQRQFLLPSFKKLLRCSQVLFLASNSTCLSGFCWVLLDLSIIQGKIVHFSVLYSNDSFCIHTGFVNFNSWLPPSNHRRVLEITDSSVNFFTRAFVRILYLIQFLIQFCSRQGSTSRFLPYDHFGPRSPQRRFI